MVGIILFMLFSFIIHIACYVYVSKVDQSYINVLFPYMLTNIPINFVFEPLYLYYFGISGSFYAYAYLYTCFSSIIIFTTIGYVALKKNWILKLRFSTPNPSNPTFSLICVLLGFLIYLPVLIEFRQYIFEPRAIYLSTRSGYGGYFFISTFFSLLGFILSLFSKHNTPLKISVVSLFTMVLLYLHGSKGQVVLLFLIIILYYIYVKKWAVGIKLVAIIIGAISVIVISLFTLTSNYEYDSILKLMTSYSDYNRNGMIIIDDPNRITYNGQLTAESNLYSRIPRAIMPDKPKNYGTLKLDEKYFPEVFEADVGSPAFGVGLQYADFGYFAIVYLSAWALLTGVLMRIFVNRIRVYKTPGDFMVLLFLTGITLLPLGDGYLLPEHLLLAFILNLLLSIKFRTSGSVVFR